jgi:hypothetical protein
MLTRGQTAVAESSSSPAMMGCFKMAVSTFSVPESCRPRTTLDGRQLPAATDGYEVAQSGGQLYGGELDGAVVSRRP